MTDSDIAAGTVMAVPSPLMQLCLNGGLALVVFIGAGRGNPPFQGKADVAEGLFPGLPGETGGVGGALPVAEVHVLKAEKPGPGRDG